MRSRVPAACAIIGIALMLGLSQTADAHAYGIRYRHAGAVGMPDQGTRAGRYESKSWLTRRANTGGGALKIASPTTTSTPGKACARHMVSQMHVGPVRSSCEQAQRSVRRSSSRPQRPWNELSPCAAVNLNRPGGGGQRWWQIWQAWLPNYRPVLGSNPPPTSPWICSVDTSLGLATWPLGSVSLLRCSC
jgi:hypothetical protein